MAFLIVLAVIATVAAAATNLPVVPATVGIIPTAHSSGILDSFNKNLPDYSALSKDVASRKLDLLSLAYIFLIPNYACYFIVFLARTSAISSDRR